jgi:hypothetical protein
MEATTMHPAFGQGLTQVLRCLVVADVVVGVANIVVGFWVDSQILPDDLKKYVLDVGDSSNGSLIAVIALTVILLAADLGLWMLKRWGRSLFTTVAVLTLAIRLLSSDPEIQSAYTSVLSDLDTMITGAILLLTWVVMRDAFAVRAA